MSTPQASATLFKVLKGALVVDQEKNFRKDLCRLARFGANISDSYSCFILLPNCVGTAFNPTAQSSNNLNENPNDDILILAGGHSLSNEVIESATITRGSGLIGWVAKHQRSIHVSPFEHDSRTLGVYSRDQKLKSFIGIPVLLKDCLETKVAGVIACDSKKSYAFSKLQGKLLEDLSREVTRTIQLSLQAVQQCGSSESWRQFIQKGHALVEGLGPESVQVIRIKTANYAQVESQIGTEATINYSDQVCRLIRQSLPAHAPSHKLPNGDLLLLVDNMMGGFYRNKVNALSSHLAGDNAKLLFHFVESPLARNSRSKSELEAAIASTSDSGDELVSLQNEVHEYRTA